MTPLYSQRLRYACLKARELLVGRAFVSRHPWTPYCRYCPIENLRAILLAVCIYVSLPLAAQAQSGNEAGITEEYANKVINEAVNTNTLFASQDFISTGRFSQRRRDQPDTSYETFRLPGEMVFGERDDTIRPFLLGHFALLKVTSGVASPDGESPADFSVANLFAISGGSGVYIRLWERVWLAPALAVSFAHLRNSYDFNNPYSQKVLRKQDEEYFNWSMNLFTYTPGLRILYEARIGARTFHYTLGFMQLLNDSIHSTSDKINIDSASSLLSNRFEYRYPLGVSIADNDLSIQPIFQWSNISGKAASGLGFVNMFEVGADVLADVKESFLFFSQLYVGASYISADNFEGYHIGFGGHF